MITQRPDRRARTVALVGLGMEILLAAFLTVMAVWSASEAIRGLAVMAAVGVEIWLFLVLIYQQRVLVQDEALETEELRREQASGLGGEALFDVEGEALLLARRRLQAMYRWLLPAFTLAIIGSLSAGGLLRWSWPIGRPLNAPEWRPIQNATVVIWFMGGAAFLTFLLSRYLTGMARQAEWRMLRSGAAWLMGLTLGAAAVCGTLAPLHYGQAVVPERVLAYVVRILLLVLAAETLFNFVLDFYRPRTPGEEPRPAFDSRLLGLFTEPGGIARSIAEAINYQFGFEVSSTWFYQLIQRSLVPLIGFAVLTLFAASSLVFIEADEEGVVERFGRKITWPGSPDGTLKPGLHLKYPWPIDAVYKVATQRLHELKIGDQAPPGTDQTREELILWTNKHESDPHLRVLVATPKLAEYLGGGRGAATRPQAGEAPAVPGGTGGVKTGEAVPVSLLRVSVVIQYRILDAWDWLTTLENPEGMLDALARREIMRYCASIDVPRLLGGERERLERELWGTIQASADARQLGIEIVFLGFQGVHPPEETAESFQDVIGSLQKRTAAIRSAQAKYSKRLTEVAGEVGRAEALAEAIRRLNDLEKLPPDQVDAEAVRQAEARVTGLTLGDASAGVLPVGGRAAGVLSEARTRRWRLENQAHGEAVLFAEEITGKNAQPRVYGVRKYLQALEQSIAGIRKYVIAAGGNTAVHTYQLNLQDPSTSDLRFGQGSQ